MKTRWFSVLSITGIVLLSGGILSGNVFGSELRWGTPTNRASVNSAPAASSVIHIPTMVAVDGMIEAPEILPVQHAGPLQPPPRIAMPSTSQFEHEFFIETSPQNRPLPPGAVHRSTPPIMPGTTPPATGRGMVTRCGDLIGLKSIREISHDIRPTRDGPSPEECVIGDSVYYGRHFAQTCFMWKASALSTRGAYFENVQLERYGNTIVCPALQPVVSGVRFFATIPLLPYKMAITPPHECVYTLGHHRPGIRTPYMVQPFPIISPRGGFLQTGSVVGILPRATLSRGSVVSSSVVVCECCHP